MLHAVNKGWHLLISKAEQLSKSRLLHCGTYIHMVLNICNKLDTYSIVLSYTLCAKVEGLHFTALHMSN